MCSCSTRVTGTSALRPEIESATLWRRSEWHERTATEHKEHNMTIKDTGPEPQSFNLEQQTVENSNYRTVAWSGRYLQLTLMSIPEGGDIGLEMHPDTDQFLRLDAGRGRVQMGATG